MNESLLYLLGFVSWTLFLLISIGVWRLTLVLQKKCAPNGFASGQKHGPDAYWRLNRAHMNAVENLPIFGILVLIGFILNLNSSIFLLAAKITFFARIAQTIFHISSNSNIVVNLRFLAFATQCICYLLMAYTLFQHLA